MGLARGPATVNGQQMITVLHLITGLDTGGTEMMLYKLVERSDPVRFRHVVVSLTDVGSVGQRITALGIRVYSLRMRRGVPDPRALWRLRAVLLRMRPDVLQTWLYHADLLGVLGATLVRTPLVWNIRSTLHHDLGHVVEVVAKLCAWLSRVPAGVVTNSETAKVMHSQLGYRPKQWMVIPNGFDTERFSPDPAARRAVCRELGVSDDSVLIGLVARFHPMKDHQTFLRAAGLLGQRNQEPHFVLIGRGITSDNATLRESIKASGVGDCVSLLGERADLSRLTSALDIATCCSTYGESFPNVIGEAMACAVPCVVTDIGDAARIVGDTGRVIPSRDPQALASAWQELIELGPEGRRELGWRARGRIVERYSLDSVVQQYETLYERLTRRGPGAAVRPT